MEGTNLIPQQRSPSISKWVNYFLLFIGLLAEFYAISISVENQIVESVKEYFPKFSLHHIMQFVRVSIIFMLIHQFFIIRNFHKLDHIVSTNKDLPNVGQWALTNKFEDILRFILFMLFACITGEVTYLLIVGSEIHVCFIEKTISWFNLLSTVSSSGIHWIVPFFVSSALLMSVLMFFWDLFGIINDWNSLPKGFLGKINREEEIVCFPLVCPYYTFIISDSFGLLFWIFTYSLVVNNNSGIIVWMLLFQLGYIVIVFIRIIGETFVNIPKIYYAFVKYWFPRCRENALKSDIDDSCSPSHGEQ